IEGINEWLQGNVGSGGGNPLATAPTPANGSLYENTWANLGWRAGYYAVSHDLYFGTAFDDVNDGVEGTFAGNLGVTTQVVGFFGFPAPDGLQAGTTYYWRVDEVNDANVASPWKGDIWSFSIPPKTAYNSSPADGAANVLQDVTLNWTTGMGASLHHVYFGDNFDEVSNAAGAVPQTDAVFTPATLEAEKTYYWRVDEFDSTGAIHKGDVWSFTTVPDIAVTNPNLTLWWTLDEGNDATAVDWSGHGNHGALVGGAPWADGYQGTGLSFEDDVYVEASGYPGVTGTAARTCCAWIRATETGNRNIMTWGENSAGQKWRMRIDSTGGLRIEVNGGSHVGMTNIADGRWHHVAVTFEDDGTPDVLDTLLYVDGQLEATAASADEPVNTADTGVVRIGESPWHNQPFAGVIDDARVYDKVLTAEEIQQVMLGNTKLAGSPVPDRDAIVDIRDIGSLSWSAGDTAASHDVYFGQDRDAVALADNTAAQFQGNQTGTSLSLATLVEFGGGDYYWRVDEVEAGGTVVAGTVWKFTVPDYLIVDDFESYNDIEEGQEGSNRIYLTWIDGYGTLTNGSQAGNLDVPFMSQGRSGAQAMPLLYDNAGKTSEATMTLTSKKDWTEQGVTKLVVWFRGDSANAADRMFVTLGNAIVYHPDDAATQDAGWNEWEIDLQEFANQGADLTNIPSITIGFGTRGAPVATGGTGTVHFDDIGLIR
ncbi:MAG: LamG domain-containing protein, partial [Planctomycetota bacterium]